MKTDNRRNLTSQMAYLAGFFDGEGCVRLKRSYQGQKMMPEGVTVRVNVEAVKEL